MNERNPAEHGRVIDEAFVQRVVRRNADGVIVCGDDLDSCHAQVIRQLVRELGMLMFD